MPTTADHAVRSANARLAGLYTYGRKPDPATEAQARRDLAEAKIARCIEEAVAAAPPLTDEQCNRLARLLGGGQRA